MKGNKLFASVLLFMGIMGISLVYRSDKRYVDGDLSIGFPFSYKVTPSNYCPQNISECGKTEFIIYGLIANVVIALIVTYVIFIFLLKERK